MAVGQSALANTTCDITAALTTNSLWVTMTCRATVTATARGMNRRLRYGIIAEKKFNRLSNKKISVWWELLQNLITFKLMLFSFYSSLSAMVWNFGTHGRFHFQQLFSKNEVYRTSSSSIKSYFLFRNGTTSGYPLASLISPKYLQTSCCSSKWYFRALLQFKEIRLSISLPLLNFNIKNYFHMLLKPRWAWIPLLVTRNTINSLPVDGSKKYCYN